MKLNFPATNGTGSLLLPLAQAPTTVFKKETLATLDLCIDQAGPQCLMKVKPSFKVFSWREEK